MRFVCQNSGHRDSDFGARIRVLGTRILREDWDSGFGGFGGKFGAVVGFLEIWCGIFLALNQNSHPKTPHNPLIFFDFPI